ncbi:uncharacterized protein LOC116264268 [Nymphaea colorata]|nr:uncharacterized protein LOC116264268 [Nymphaea colorata]
MASSRKSMGVSILILLIIVQVAAAGDKSKSESGGSDKSGCKKVSCRHKEFKECHGQVHSCPAACPRTCKVDCGQCKPVCECDRPGAVCDDPRFIGGDGITFYFHGQKDRDFCLVSDTNLHINGHFIGKRGDGMKRDFTWVQSIGLLLDDHKLFIGAKKVAQWDDAIDQLAIAFDGEPVFLPNIEDAQWTSAASTFTITRSGRTNEIVVEAVNKFKITAKVVPIGKEESKIHNYGITDDDCFAHLDLSFRFYSLSGAVNGVLGQTYADNYKSRAKMGVKMPVLGGEREFLSSGLFATDCAAAQFKSTGRIIMEGGVDHHEELECKSSMNGRGIVCKK